MNDLGQWLAGENSAHSMHVVPIGDLIAHELDDSCPCGPAQLAGHDGWVVVHNSLDGRERTER